jgi:serine phosphatase RsbU (regulator of sigma subunit)/anti-sigma regulatory factor (Ser/Thr protein kinase)
VIGEPGEAFVHADSGVNSAHFVTSGGWSGSRATGVGSGAPLRGRALRYGTAATLACASVALAASLSSTDRASFAPLFGAVAVSVWLAGLGPGLLAVAIAWTGALFVLSDPRYSFALADWDEAARWAVALVVALVITLVAWVLQHGRAKATSAAGEADEARERVEQLRATASALSAAATPDDVARALTVRAAEALQADGAGVGLIEDTLLRILEPVGLARDVLTDHGTVPLESRMVLATAAREGELRWANDRDEVERAYPESLRRTPTAGTFLAAPLVVRGRTIGALGFLFADPGRATPAQRSLARLVAELGSQALDRAMFLTEERESRERLEQILAIAPRVQAGLSPEDAVVDVCRSARETFTADAAHVWAVHADGFEVVHREPADEALPVGTVLPASDFRVLPRAVAERRHAFVRDVPSTLEGLAYEAAAAAGTQTTLRVPIVVAGEPNRLLVLEWVRDLPEPDAGFVALVRRFADQAGLALEHAELQEAQEEGIRRAAETRRLLRLTAALAGATTLDEVSDVILDQCRDDLGAMAGVVGRVVEHTDEFELLRSFGFEEGMMERWQRFLLESDLPLADAMRRNEIVALGSVEDRDRLYPGLAGEPTRGNRGSWLSIPLPFGERAVGGVALAFGGPRSFTDRELDLVRALGRQAGQAFERARLLEAEQQARGRAERAAAGLAQLHALSTTLSVALDANELAVAASTQIAAVLDVRSVGVYGLDGSEVLELLGGVGALDVDRGLPGISLGAHNPLADAFREETTLWLEQSEDWASYAEASDLAWPLGAVPLFAQGRPIGVLVVMLAPDRSSDPEQRRFVETVARQVAPPLDRVRLLERERAARRRTELLQALTAGLSGALSEEEVASAFLEHAAAALDADVSVIAVPDERENRLDVIRWRGFDLSTNEVERSTTSVPLDAPHPLADSFRRRRTIILTPERLQEEYPQLVDRTREQGVQVSVVCPLGTAGRVLGVAAFSWRRPHQLTTDDSTLIATLASQCAQALDRARRYESERTIAETLQRSVLPELLPSIDGLDVAARYLPGTTGVEVGGDWFDVIELENGRVGLVVGDVVGKGVQAAATMSQLRNALRAFAFERLKPSAAVTRLNRLLDTLPEAPFATLAFVTVDPRTGTCRYALAGHPPPLVRYPSGKVEYLEGGRSLPLGIGGDVKYRQAVAALPAGSIVVLYTDGLIERRDRSLEDGLNMLLDLVAEGPRAPDALADYVLAQAFRDHERSDDVAVLVVRLPTVRSGQLELTLPSEPDALQTARDELRAWLARGGIDGAAAHDIVLAAWEACANAVEHPEQPREAAFTLEAARDGDRVRLLVRDGGRWRPERPREERGLGLRLMRSLMESVEVDRAPTGTVVRMERRVSAAENGHGPRDMSA